MAIKNFKEILNKTAQRVDIKDRKIFERGMLPAYFGRGLTDTIEFILYDQGDNQLPQGEEGKKVRYINISAIDNIRKYILIARGGSSNKPSEYFVDIERLINEAGYSNGLFRTQVTLLNKRVGSEHNQNKVWIHEIAPSRTEIRVLPVKAESERIVKDLNERYNILLENGDFRDDILNRLDGFTNSLNTNDVLAKIRALYGEDYINNVKREFKIQNFDLFVNDIVDKAREAINYYVTSREFNVRSNNYGKSITNPNFKKSFSGKTIDQRLDLGKLLKKANEIVCDVIDFYLPKRNLNATTVPSMELLESRDKVQKILQKFTSTKNIDTKVTQRRRVVKPSKVVSGKVIIPTPPVKKVEKPIPPNKPIEIPGEPEKKYFNYQVTNIVPEAAGVTIPPIKYINMSGDEVKFNLPTGKSVKVCALEGSIKAQAGISIVKKELCMVDTPVPKFVKPKPPIVKIPPIVGLPIFTLPKDFKINIPEIKIPPIVFNAPFSSFNNKINIGPIYAPGASGDAGALQTFTKPPKNIRTPIKLPKIPTMKLPPFSLPVPKPIKRAGGGGIARGGMGTFGGYRKSGGSFGSGGFPGGSYGMGGF